MPLEIHIMPKLSISDRVGKRRDDMGGEERDMDFKGRYEISHVIIYFSHTWMYISIANFEVILSINLLILQTRACWQIWMLGD